MKVPSRVWVFARVLFFVRLAFVSFLVLSGHPQPALQLGYKPALALDFPISLFYVFVGPIHGPTFAAIVGPIWWFFLPIVGWWLIWGRRGDSRGMQSNHRWRGP
jgi:hypothetical protein